jgi:hypothetical protein
MIGAGVITLVLIGWRRQPNLPLTNQEWGMATLSMIAILMAIWYAFLSVGFERYTFLGFMCSLLLLGNLVYKAIMKLSQRFHINSQYAYSGLLVVLILLVVGGNAYPIVKNWNDPNNVQEMADYIDANIPQTAVIESVEVELNSLTTHREIHRANYVYLYEAIRQRWHENIPFDLKYNVLQSNPDYLVVGQTSEWLNLYDPSLVQVDFKPLAQFGEYQILERIR